MLPCLSWECLSSNAPSILFPFLPDKAYSISIELISNCLFAEVATFIHIMQCFIRMVRLIRVGKKK